MPGQFWDNLTTVSFIQASRDVSDRCDEPVAAATITATKPKPNVFTEPEPVAPGGDADIPLFGSRLKPGWPYGPHFPEPPSDRSR